MATHETLEAIRNDCEAWLNDEMGIAADDLVMAIQSAAEVELSARATKEESSTKCKTCGSEIVATVNDSIFGDGECDGCEYRRYTSQPALLEASQLAYGVLCDLSYHWCFRRGAKRFARANEIIDKLASALNAYGKDS